jgi:hypothetical protein
MLTFLLPVLAAMAFEASATLVAADGQASLRPGRAATLVVELHTDAPLGGEARKPLLQLDVPDGIELVGGPKPEAERTSPADWLAVYTGFPHGRLVESARVEIPLRVTQTIASDATIGINVVTYLDGAEASDARFVRLRLQQPIVAGARALPSDEEISDWGRPGLVHIGDRAADFDLAAGDGGRLVLSELLAKEQPVFLLTYRSDW